ncbi:hypothetical protein [Agromyces sp. H66]|uniref:hypothetical protein n=1 Tax=Agromyces sp. H66 TaxID=2529859 RepID=UPI0010AB31CD|nr:hypothetical protein [Agromyces sp. H66]
METSTIVWIIVGIVVIIAIAVVWLLTSRQRREAHRESERQKAAELRQSAHETDVARREREAEAARAAAAAKQAEADAAQARLESERLARESTSHQSDAEKLRSEAEERLQKADAVDPDVDCRDAEAAGTVRDEREAAHREHDTAYTTEAADADRDRRVDDASRRDTETGRRI